MLDNNLLLLTDSYKVTHWKQYSPGTQNVYSYLEARGGASEEIIFFGLQYFIKRYLTGQVITREKIEEAEKIYKSHFGQDLFNKTGWEYILEKHGGMLPVEICAVKEGLKLPISRVLMTVENTDPHCYWLTNYLETLLVQVWYPCSVATLSHEMRQMILGHLEKTGDPVLIDFKLHDFGFRGVSSVESAGIGGLAHLLNFKGTDTVQAIKIAMDYYNETEPVGYSIPASEHSTITSWGRDKERGAMENMLNQYPTGLVACVSDSYDIFSACKNIWGDKLKEKVLMRDGVLVIRPDSGEHEDIYPRVLDILGSKFGYERNSKGYKVLNPKVRLIQGDGIDYNSCNEILNILALSDWSADNIAFGMGGALLQKLNRDTHSFAFKCSQILKNDTWYDVYKDPITDKGKKSKRGRFYRNLKPVFINGDLLKDWSFQECRSELLGGGKTNVIQY